MRRLLLLPLAALVFTGCGASDPVASEDVSEAVEKTASVDSSRIAIVSIEPDERITIDGVIDYDDRRARLKFDAEPTDDEAEPFTGEMLYVGTTMYLPSSSFTAFAGMKTEQEVKPWLSVDLADEEPSLEALVFPFPFIDPTRLLAAVEEVSGEVESLGEMDVRGVETDGYALRIDLRRVIEEAPATHREALLEQLEERDQKELPIKVWIDADGFARRVFFRDARAETTFDLYDFGVESDIDAPRGDQVEDFNNLVPAVEGDGDEEVDSGMTVEEDE